MRTDRRVKHGSSTSRPDNPEITGAGRVAIAVGQEEEPQERAEKEKRHPFPLLSLSFVSLSFLAESRCFVNPFRLFPLENASDFDLQEPGSILVVDLLENLIRQSQSINPPPPLRRNRRRGVIEILVLGFQKPVIDFIQLVGEDLLGRVGSVRNGVGSKYNSIPILLNNLAGHARLSSKLPDATGHLPIH